MDIVSKQMIAHGAAEIACGRYDEALGYFSDIVEFDPSDWRSRLFLAVCLSHTGHLCEARHELTFIAELCPVTRYRELALLQLRNVIYVEETKPELRMRVLPVPSADASHQLAS